jgi:hypothetical protein
LTLVNYSKNQRHYVAFVLSLETVFVPEDQVWGPLWSSVHRAKIVDRSQTAAALEVKGSLVSSYISSVRGDIYNDLTGRSVSRDILETSQIAEFGTQRHQIEDEWFRAMCAWPKQFDTAGKHNSSIWTISSNHVLGQFKKDG